ncbi:hypothetical protein A8L59_04130 [Pseudomonas koreensis]|uniref:Uncharacterized protein n=1 Tax=Pseudomonas koreensis TaxID=198620 RepID=A0AAC9FW70_9PSED|nr:hypothetical protein A8L59_04130 [Pseudomonas koreensis]KAB0516314.1 hypothetical protein F7R05_03485 [Pseudomonas koreensis]
MESPGFWRWLFVEVSGDLGVFGNIVFLVGVSISVYLGCVYISVAAVTAAWGSALTAGHFWQTPQK